MRPSKDGRNRTFDSDFGDRRWTIHIPLLELDGLFRGKTQLAHRVPFQLLAAGTSHHAITTGLEPATSWLTTRCSDQLNYATKGKRESDQPRPEASPPGFEPGSTVPVGVRTSALPIKLQRHQSLHEDSNPAQSLTRRPLYQMSYRGRCGLSPLELLLVLRPAQGLREECRIRTY